MSGQLRPFFVNLKKTYFSTNSADKLTPKDPAI